MTVRPRIVVLFGILILLVLIAQWPLALAARSGPYALLDPIIDVHSILSRDYVEPIDEQAMQGPMLEAMVGALNDPFTVYVPPAEARDFDKDLRGRYVGIGAEVSHEDGILQIVTPMAGSPALEAGVMAGDIVLEIDGVATDGLSTDECIDLLLGEVGSPVNIRVRQEGGEERVLTVIRRQIVTQTVAGLTRGGEEWNYCLDHDLGFYYIAINQFNETTFNELRTALETISVDRIGGLVLDLRENPGGALNAAIEVADLFLTQGEIVSVKDRKGNERSWKAQSADTLPEFPMIVLVNRASASAAEIVAGALQDRGRAIVLGMRTFGKGSVQEVRELGRDRGTLKFTAAYYMLPSGRNISRRAGSTTWGVDPDPGFVVPTAELADRDRFIAHRAYHVIRNGQSDAPECADSDWIRSTLKDEQLALAVTSLRQRIGTGRWEPVGADSGELAALEEERLRLMQRRDLFLEQLESIDERLKSLTIEADPEEQMGAATESDKADSPQLERVAEGEVILRDAAGAQIGRYLITGDIVAALNELQLKPIETGN